MINPIRLFIVCMLCVGIMSTVYADTVQIQIYAGQIIGEIKPLLGVNGGPYKLGEAENPHVEEQYRDLGVTMVRTHDFYGPVDMYEMYPDDSADPNDSSSYDFEESDLRLTAAHENGHEIYFRLGNSYNYSGEPPANVDHYVEAAKNVIRHYTQGLWDGYEFPVQYIEIWNEPGNTHFWTGTRIEFLRLFERLATELKAEFPDLKIGGPGFLPMGYFVQDENNYPRILLGYCQENNVHLDFLSWHIYGDNPSDYRQAGVYYRNLMDEFGYTEAESHITEWNTGEGPRRYNIEGAALMTGAWIGLQDADVDVSLFYRGQDSSMDLPTFYGLMYADGTYKKMGYAFKTWSWVSQYPQRIQLEEDADSIDAIAALSKDGQSLIILITHYPLDDTSDPIESYQINLQGFNFIGEELTLKRYIISSIHNLELIEEKTFTNLNSEFLMNNPFPENTVEIIEITKEQQSNVNYWDVY